MRGSVWAASRTAPRAVPRTSAPVDSARAECARAAALCIPMARDSLTPIAAILWGLRAIQQPTAWPWLRRLQPSIRMAEESLPRHATEQQQLRPVAWLSGRLGYGPIRGHLPDMF